MAIHGVPDSRELIAGDMVSIDVSVFLDGFVGDTCGTVLVNDGSIIDEKAEKLMSASEGCLTAGINAIKVGDNFTRIGEECESFIMDNYPDFSISTQFVGHGLGRHFHMAPQVLHWTKKSGFVGENQRRYKKA